MQLVKQVQLNASMHAYNDVLARPAIIGRCWHSVQVFHNFAAKTWQTGMHFSITADLTVNSYLQHNRMLLRHLPMIL